MPVTYTCPTCKSNLTVELALPAGRVIRCPKCLNPFPAIVQPMTAQRIPAQQPLPPPQAAPARAPAVAVPPGPQPRGGPGLPPVPLRQAPPSPGQGSAAIPAPVPDGFLELTPDMEVHEPKKSHSAIIGCMIFAVGLTLIGCGVGTAAWLGYLPKHLALSKLFGKATAAETTVSPNSEEPTPAEPMP